MQTRSSWWRKPLNTPVSGDWEKYDWTNLFLEVERERRQRLEVRYSHSVNPLSVKVTTAINRACELLPVRLARKISSIRFGPEGVSDLHFEVVFTTGKIIRFDNVDTFPTEADIAHIAVEAP